MKDLAKLDVFLVTIDQRDGQLLAAMDQMEERLRGCLNVRSGLGVGGLGIILCLGMHQWEWGSSGEGVGE